MVTKLNNLLRPCLLLIAMLFMSSAVMAQDRTVTGKVIGGDNNEPLVGASIVIKGTTKGALTDIDGNYSVSAPDNATLVISFVGYAPQEVAVAGQSNISVTLNASTLDEVIVTGYAIESKKSTTGAVSTIKSKDLRAIPSGNVEQQLQGRVSGVTVITNGQPGTNSIIRVRGFGAFGGNEPLYIVDGVPVGSTDFLSPDDIETSTVLKDAAAASIYGARAANGVIVYTTKKGAKSAKKMSISYDGLYGSTDPNVAGAPKMLTPQEDAQWTHIAYKNNAIANNVAVKYTHPQYGTNETPVFPAYLHANGANGVTGTVDVAAIKAAALAKPGEIFLIKPNLAGTDWFDEITRTAPLQRHSLGFSGGGENSRFYVGMSVQDQKGILINNSFKRYTFRTNTEFNLTKRLRLGQNLQFTYRSVLGQAGGNNGLGIASDESQVLSAYRMPRIIPVFDELGQYASTKAAGFNNPRNPVRTLTLNNGNDRNFNANAFGNVYLEIDPIDNLTLRSSIGGQYNNFYFKDYNYRYLGDSEPEANNGFGEGSGYVYGYVFSNTASYKLKVGNHGATIFGGMEALNTGKGRSINGSGQNPFSTDLDYQNLSTVSNPQVGSGLFSGVNFYSLFGKLDYNWNEKYYVTGLIRRDGSSRFGSNNRYGVFPAFSAAWRVTGEEFLKNVSFISDLKIRGGWGQMGNSNNVNPNNQFSLYGSNRGNTFYPISGQNNGADEGYNRTRIGNPDAKWETSEMTNIGFDASFLNNKLELVMDVWRKDTRDLLFPVPLAGVLGVNSSVPSVNIGNMRNQGIDFQIINRGNITKDLKYEVTLNNSFLQNEIVFLTPDIKFIGATTGGDVGFRNIFPTRNAVGQPLASFFGYKVLGYFSSAADVTSSPAQPDAAVGRFKYQDVNGDGKITPDDRTFLGNPIPDYSGGLTLNLTYKKFTLESFIYGTVGNQIWNQSKWFTDFFGSFEGSAKGVRAKESWTPALGNNAKAPIWESASNISTNAAGNSWYVENGNFLRLQNLAIGYTLENDFIQKVGLSRAKITVAAFNLFTITKYSGLDPMVGGAVDTNFGIDVGNYPTTRGFNVALSLGF
jgi:TonB-dependent starch-binding outer membrane protein SusC